MTSVFGIIFPIYAMILLGYGLVRFNVFQIADIRVMGRFVLNVAFPALIFQAVASRPISEVFYADYMLAFLLGCLAVMALSYVVFSRQNLTPELRALGTMGTSCPNSGFIGYATMLLVFPEHAGLILALNLLVENLIIVPGNIILLEAAHSKNEGPLLRKIGRIFWDVLKMPLILGLLLGLIVSVFGWQLPGPLTVATSMLAASASAVALIVIGGQLVEVKPSQNMKLAVQVVIGKLIAHPTLTIAIALALNFIGVIALEGDFLVALLLSTAMPTFGIYVLFGQRVGHGGLSGFALVGATVGAFFTLSLLLLLLT